MWVECDFSDKTVVVAGSGCDVGATLVRAFADSGARVIALDRDEARVNRIAAENPHRIEALKLDVMRPGQCQLLGRIWEHEPIHILVHLQPLRDPLRPGAALQAIPSLTRALRRALEAGRARVLFLFAGAGALAKAETRCYAYAMTQLAGAMQEDLGRAVLRVNAIEMGSGVDAGGASEALLGAVFFLTGPQGGDTGGSVLPVLSRSD